MKNRNKKMYLSLKIGSEGRAINDFIFRVEGNYVNIGANYTLESFLARYFLALKIPILLINSN